MKIMYLTRNRPATTDLMLANAIIDAWIEAPESAADRARAMCKKLPGAVLDIQHLAHALGYSKAKGMLRVIANEGGQSVGNGRVLMPGSDTRQMSLWGDENGG